MNRIENKDKKMKPSSMATFDVDRNIKENAIIKNVSLYNEIKDIDLIATEFKYDHVPCYQDFTRNIENIKESVQQYGKEYFVKAEIFKMENIIKRHQVVSLTALHEMYNTGDGDWRYRFKLKEMIEKQFANDISFVTLPLPNSSFIVMSGCT